MKKLIILVLAVMLALGTTACANNDTKELESSSSLTPTGNFDYVPQYASNGEITGLLVSIGMSTEAVRELYNGTETSSAVAEDAYDFLEAEPKNGLVKMSCVNLNYYFYQNSEDKGISAIANMGDAYGFENGISTSNDVKSICGENDVYTPEDSELFFLPATPDDCTALSYQYGKYTVKFFFISDYLTATFIYDNTVFQYPSTVKLNDN